MKIIKIAKYGAVAILGILLMAMVYYSVTEIFLIKKFEQSESTNYILFDTYLDNKNIMIFPFTFYREF